MTYRPWLACWAAVVAAQCYAIATQELALNLVLVVPGVFAGFKAGAGWAPSWERFLASRRALALCLCGHSPSHHAPFGLTGDMLFTDCSGCACRHYQRRTALPRATAKENNQ